ncbi:MAG: CRISPR-associated endonuclease Cas1 [Geobacteraceae bacterium]|nr:CRISPR-associated endonuclease Cas1 [Geobacteraceae bacterium]
MIKESSARLQGLTLVVDRRGTIVTLLGTSLRIEREGCPIENVPLALVERLVVCGNVMVACDVWRALAGLNIPGTLIPVRGKGATAHLGAGLGGDAELRASQHTMLGNPMKSLALGRDVLTAKITGQCRIIGRYFGEKAEEPLRRELGYAVENLETAETRDSLMGVEGAAAARYFKTIGANLPEHWRFHGRNRRPPRDPFNSLLSLSYVLAGGEVMRALQARGLDPGAGFLHAQRQGRPALVLDLLEPLRPLIDEFALSLLDRRLTPDDFTTSSQEGCHLGKSGRGIFFAAWCRFIERDNNEGLTCATSHTVAWFCRRLASWEKNIFPVPEKSGSDTVNKK